MGGQPAQDRVLQVLQQRIADLGRDLLQAVVAGGVRGVVQPEQGVQGGFRPGLAGMGFGHGDDLAGQVRTRQRVRGAAVVGGRRRR